MTFIDDYSCKTWIYFFKTKESEEVFNKFKEFKAQIENLSGKRIKILRLDNGGEYTSTEFSDFYKEAGIRRELAVPYNPQQNEVAERKNRTIVEVAKAMIHDQILPPNLWLSSLHTCAQGEKDEVRTFRQEENFCGIQ